MWSTIFWNAVEVLAWAIIILAVIYGAAFVFCTIAQRAQARRERRCHQEMTAELEQIVGDPDAPRKYVKPTAREAEPRGA